MSILRSVRPASLLALLVLIAGALLTSSLRRVAAADPPGVTPNSVTATLAPGASTTVTKTVTAPTIPPKPDLVFLADTTGSMGSAIANVKANVVNVTNTVQGAQPQAQFAVAEYKDDGAASCASDPFAF